jgi:hypothetical protein
MEVVPMLILLVAMLVREWTFFKEKHEDRVEHDKQVNILLQRIQSPVAATQEHAIQTLNPDREPIGMPLLTDEDYKNLISA